MSNRLAGTVPGLLEARAADEPDGIAILVPGSGALTFGEWAERSRRVARGLLDRGVRPGDRVGLLFGGEDWIDFAVSYCAAQLAGGVAVPISTLLPPAQVARVLADCGASAVVHGTSIEAVRPGTTPAALEAEGPPNIDVRPDDLAQILYTSGTTGEPKGVTATHGNLTHGHEPHPLHRPLAHSEHFLHAYPIGTNAAQTMLLNALTAAPTALAMPRFDAAGFCELIETFAAGTAFLVPAMAIDLLNTGAHRSHDLSSVHLLGSTAAPLPPPVARALCDAFPNATLVNYYSSTEAAPAQTVMIYDPDRPDSLGETAMPGDLAITDEHGRPLPPGEVGEVRLRAPAAPRAYYGDPQASAAVFVDGWTRMGDLGYLDEDGYLYLVDRESDVIKSGALKISTLRVEAALYEHPQVAEAAVIGIPHPVMGAAVAAAVVPRDHLGLAELRAFLKERLARHEIPTRLLTVASLPRNDAGKVLKRDLKQLFTTPAAPHGTPSSATAAGKAASGAAVPGAAAAGGADGGELARALRRLWADVLDRAPGSAEDDFFALGGDSFKATRLAAMGSQVLGMELPASFAFDFPTLSAQAHQIQSTSPTRAEPRAFAEEATGVPLSSLQEYFLRWIHQTPEPRAVSAVHVAIRIREELRITALERALREVVARHDALRTVFPVHDGEHEAVVLPDLPPELARLRAAGATAAERERDARRLACTGLERPFDIERGPLVRAMDIELAPEDHVLVLGVHHLVFDGWSMGILLRELGACYIAACSGSPSRLPPAPPGGAAAVTAAVRGEWPQTRSFWQRTLDGAPPGFTRVPGRRPTDHFTASSVPLSLPAPLATRLRDTARAHKTTPYMALLAAWSQVLAKWTGDNDLVLLSPVPGRTRPEYDAVVGCLVQSLLLRIDVSGDPGFAEMLSRVRRVVLEAGEHQHYPYEEFSRRVPYPGWFRFESWGGVAHLPGVESGPFELPRELMFDWPLPAGETDLGVPELALTEQPDGRIDGWLVFNRHAFDRPAVEALARTFASRLDQAVR